MNLNRLYDARWDNVKRTVMALVSRFDARPDPAEELVAVATLFLMMCVRFNLEPRRVLEVAERILRRARDVAPQYPRGVEDYLRNEFPDA